MQIFEAFFTVVNHLDIVREIEGFECTQSEFHPGDIVFSQQNSLQLVDTVSKNLMNAD